MKHKRIRAGDLVEIMTVDRARGGRSVGERRPKPARIERWRAVVIRPSVMGRGWWVVKKLSGEARGLMTYTVPEAEIVRVVRRRS